MRLKYIKIKAPDLKYIKNKAPDFGKNYFVEKEK